MILKLKLKNSLILGILKLAKLKNCECSFYMDERVQSFPQAIKIMSIEKEE